jgi:hypothetical protein
VITDRFTARVLGAIVLLMAACIVIGCFFFTKPEIVHRPTFPLVVLASALPLVGLALWLFRKAGRLRDDEPDGP